MKINTMVIAEAGGITYFSLPCWEKWGFLKHGFSSRNGGVSKGPFVSLNLGFRGGDRSEAIHENRRRFLGLWGKKEEDLICGEQVHGTEVFLVNESFAREANGQIPSTDALVTAQPGMLLGAFSADCLLAFFVEPSVPAIGLAHAGWRGTCMGIFDRVVNAMCLNFGARTDSIEVLLAPSIGACCYEVGKEVLDILSASPWREEIVLCPGTRPGHPFMDLQETNFNILCKAGIRAENIFRSDYCTHCNQHLFYSYRREGGGPTGSQMGIIFLNQGGSK
ncbi:MAG: peptidoglycan editing factor PgeF [Bacillota bacterium]|nr:peptidoglycan editing factor PgeF [Bacillota bacterium]